MRRMRLWLAGALRLVSVAALTVALQAGGRSASSALATTAAQRLGAWSPVMTSLAFEPLAGRAGPGGSFLARVDGYSALIRPSALRIDAGGSAVGLSFIGADAQARLEPEARLPGVVSYFQSRDPLRWRADVPTYARLRVRDLYPGIDLVYYVGRQGLEYDLVVRPGADPGRIRIATFGAAPQVRHGDLVWRTNHGAVALAAPSVYQPGGRMRLGGSYRLDTDGMLTIRLAPYDRRRTLVIDPYLKVIGTSGYNSIGGTGTAIAMDSAGNTYITGTGSGQFPTTPGAALTTLANQDVADSAIVVMKLDPAGKLLFSTYLGTVVGNGTTGLSSAGIAVDGAGDVYVTGSTDGTNFPLVHPLISFPPPNGSGGQAYHAFVAKLNPTGSRVLYATYLGGDLSSHGWSIAVDRAGTAYVAGSTAADQNPDTRQFPVTAGNHSCAPGTDGFVAIINAAGSKFINAACIGSTGTTRALGIALDQSHNIFLTGYTNVYPPKAALRLVSRQPGANNAFVIKFDPAMRRALYLAFLGSGSDTRASAIAVDRAGDAFITGSTTGESFPTTAGAFMRQQDAPNAGLQAAFAAEISPTGASLRYATYLSGNTYDAGTGIAADTRGDAYVTGTVARNLNMAESAGAVTFPVTKGAMYTAFNVNGDGFLTELNPSGTGAVSSTLLGGLVPGGIALGPDGHPTLTGSATRNDSQIAEAKDTWFVVWSL